MNICMRAFLNITDSVVIILHFFMISVLIIWYGILCPKEDYFSHSWYFFIACSSLYRIKDLALDHFCMSAVVLVQIMVRVTSIASGISRRPNLTENFLIL